MEVGQQSSILLIHAFLGCRTTCQIHNIGKGKVFPEKRLQAIFDEKSSVFYDKNAAKEDVKMEGEALMLSLFRKGTGKSLGDLRAKMFSEKVKNNNHVKPQSFPPTTDATTLHSLRVYHQIQSWLCNDIDPTNWGWRVADGKLVPVMMTQEPAPGYLLKYVRCSCKEGACHENSRCSCQKYGIQCTLSCSNCNGVSCQNPQRSEAGVAED